MQSNAELRGGCQSLYCAVPNHILACYGLWCNSLDITPAGGLAIPFSPPENPLRVTVLYDLPLGSGKVSQGATLLLVLEGNWDKL